MGPQWTFGQGFCQEILLIALFLSVLIAILLHFAPMFIPGMKPIYKILEETVNAISLLNEGHSKITIDEQYMCDAFIYLYLYICVFSEAKLQVIGILTATQVTIGLS